MIGGLTANAIVRRIGEVGTTVLGMILLALPIGVIAWTSDLTVMLAALIVIGVSLPWLFVAVMTLVQRRTPQSIMGRVSMALEVLMGTPQAISLAVGALLVALISYRAIFLVIALVTALGAAYIAGLLRREIAADIADAPARAQATADPSAP